MSNISQLPTIYKIDEDEEKIEEVPDQVSHVEDPDKTFDEVLVSTLPHDEDIEPSNPHARQEENMMSCDPFEGLNDTLLHDFGSEEILEDPLDATDPLERRQTKHYILRIKPLVMKRRWRGIYVIS